MWKSVDDYPGGDFLRDLFYFLTITDYQFLLLMYDLKIEHIQQLLKTRCILYQPCSWRAGEQFNRQ